MTTSRMTESRWTNRCKRAAWVGTLGLVLLAAGAAGSARAADDDDNSNSIWNLDQRLWNGIMGGLGLKSDTGPTIEYRERSPLVVPPQRTLPPPEAAAAKSPAWPVDPDVKRREDAAAKRKAARAKSFDIDTMGANLNPSQLGPAGSAGTTTTASTSAPPTNSDGSNMLPSQLGYFGGLFSWTGASFGMGPKEEVGTFKAEPPRTDLTAPPVGYQTPSPAQPYGMTKRIEQAKPQKIYEDFGTK